jgi:hypothetical protein
MFPYTFEVVTAITLAVIGIILALYFMVLKRRGWLREDSHESFYRCPNPECRKVFDKPIVLTDLSQNPTSVRSACPHCGFDLEAASLVRTSKKLEKTVKTPPNLEEPLKRVEASKITKEKQSSPTSKSLQARPPECRHFFGYLKKIPKNTSIPDECYGCPRMVDCLYYDASE